MREEERVRWAPKVRPERMWQLYQRDALGIADEELVDDVGMALHARCRSILLVSNAQVECPRCGLTVDVGWRHCDSDAIACPGAGCLWHTTFGEYHRSWRHRDLIGAKIEGAVRTFVERYVLAASAVEKMLLIDGLIHAFHHSHRDDPSLPTRSAANNLIEGSHEQVIALLDRLAYGERGTSGLPETRAAWRKDVRKMWGARQNRVGGESVSVSGPTNRPDNDSDRA